MAASDYLKEAFQYFPLRSFVQEAVEGSIDIRGKDAIILPLEEAMGSYGHFLKARRAKEAAEEQDPFYLQEHEKGYFVFIPPKTQTSLEILLTNGMPKVEIMVGKEADVTLVIKEVSTEPKWMNTALSLSLDAGARCKIKRTLQEHVEAFHFTYLRASLAKDAFLETVTVAKGSKGSRQDYKVSLTGENSEANLNGLWRIDQSKHHSTHVQISHLAPHTRSMQLFKGVQEDVSQANFTGKIFVAKEAQKTQAYQLNKNILLSERAICNSKPGLQIFADDVKASHGATTGQLDKKQLFYLTSRGIPLPKATELLLQGFCHEITNLL